MFNFKLNFWRIWLPVLGLSLFWVLSTTAQITNEDCYPFGGFTTPSSVSNLNEGSLEFTLSEPADAYKHCIEKPSSIVDNSLKLIGWVWNTNLGWVSLNSELDAGVYKNRGIATGGVPYGSTLDVTRDAGGKITGGQLHGYFWGDNMGWLRLHCDNSSYVLPQAGSANYCATSNHHVDLTVDGSGNGLLSGFAWSDNVGWVNFAGVTVPVASLVSQISAEVTYKKVQYSNDGCLVGDLRNSAIPVSNGLEAYVPIVKIFEGTGASRINVTEDFFNDVGSNLSFSFVDTRHHQLVGVSNTSNVGLGTVSIQSPVCGRPDTVNVTLPGSVTSYGWNYGVPNKGLTKSAFGFNSSNSTMYVKSFSDYVRSFVPAASGEFRISNIRLTYTAPDLSVVNQDIPINVDLPFDPPFTSNVYQGLVSNVAAECFDEKNMDGSFDLNLGTNTPIHVCASVKKGVFLGDNFSFEVTHDLESMLTGESVSMDFLDSPTSTSPYPNPIGFTSTGSYAKFKFYPVVRLADLGDEGSQGISIQDLLKNAKVSLKVLYNAPNSIKVERMGAELNNLFFKVAPATVTGNIQANAFEQIKDDVSSKGASQGGGQSSTKERILNNISEVGQLENVGCQFIGQTISPTLLANGGCELKEGEKVHMMTFESGSNTPVTVKLSDLEGWSRGGGANPSISPEGGHVLVLRGANLIIDEDVFYTNDSGVYDPTKVLGLIVLKYGGRGGYAYITKDVTDLHLQAYVQKSVFSVQKAQDAVNANVSDGVPDRSAQNSAYLYSQFTFVGQMLSQNTVGGAISGKPKLGNGSLASNFSAAQDYDLNFIRFSPLGYDIRKELDVDGNTVYKLKSCGQYATGSYGEVTLPEFMDPALQVGPWRNKTNREQAVCWKSEIDGVPVLNSRYMSEVYYLTSGQQYDYEKRVVNFIFDAPFGGMPIFGE